jgi:hypothetical protein
MDKVSTTAPISPPIIDARNAPPSARPASPRRAIAKPSMAVGPDDAEVGVPNKIAEMVSDV